MRIEDPERITSPPDGSPDEQQPRWRKDFPIDWPSDEYRSRREFTWLLIITSLAFVVGQAWIVVLSFLRGQQRGMSVEIPGAARLHVGESRLFWYPTNRDACILVRVTSDQYLAYSQKCTHLSCPVIPKPSEGVFHCPCHEGQFDLQTGEPLAGPPRRPLTRIRLEKKGDRIFAVGITEGRA